MLSVRRWLRHRCRHHRRLTHSGSGSAARTRSRRGCCAQSQPEPSLNRSASQSRAVPSRSPGRGRWRLMDCRARGLRCPEAGKDRWRWRRWWLPAGSGHGRREPREGRSAERGHGGPVGAQRAGAEVGAVGVAAGAPWPSRSAAKSREESGCWTGLQPGRPAPWRAWSCGDKGAPAARGMEMAWGKPAAPSWRGGAVPEDVASKDPHSQRTHTHTHTHTHTLVGRPARITQALPAPRGHPEGQTTDICTHIHTYVHTGIPPAHQRPPGHRQ